MTLTDEVKISREAYFRLKCAELKLDLLEAGGVDNWEGYDESLKDTYDTGVPYWKQVEELKRSILGETND